MKLSCLLATLLLLALPWGLGAQTNDITIPFPFVAYDTEFAAGDYSLSLLSYHLKLAPSDPKDGTGNFLIARPGHQVKADGQIALFFEKASGVYLLREYRAGTTGTSLSLPLSKNRRDWWERRLIGQAGRTEFVLIAAKN